MQWTKSTADKLYFTRSNLLMRLLPCAVDSRSVESGQGSGAAACSVVVRGDDDDTASDSDDDDDNDDDAPATSLQHWHSASRLNPSWWVAFFLSLSLKSVSVWTCVCVCVMLGKPAARLQEAFQKKAQVYFVRACACLFE